MLSIYAVVLSIGLVLAEEAAHAEPTAKDAKPAAESGSKYKLYYFPVRGRVAPIRMIFHQAGVPFEPVDVAFADWPKLKPTMPFGHLPIVEKDGKMLAESRAIARYIAGMGDLLPSDAYQRAEADMYVDAFTDCNEVYWRAVGPLNNESMEIQTEAYMEVRNQSFDKCLQRFSDFLDKNGGKYLVGNQTSWADIWIAELVDQITSKFGDGLFATFPTLKKNRDMVFSLPIIKKYVAERKYKQP